MNATPDSYLKEIPISDLLNWNRVENKILIIMFSLLFSAGKFWLFAAAPREFSWALGIDYESRGILITLLVALPSIAIIIRSGEYLTEFSILRPSMSFFNSYIGSGLLMDFVLAYTTRSGDSAWDIMMIFAGLTIILQLPALGIFLRLAVKFHCIRNDAGQHIEYAIERRRERRRK